MKTKKMSGGGKFFLIVAYILTGGLAWIEKLIIQKAIIDASADTK